MAVCGAEIKGLLDRKQVTQATYSDLNVFTGLVMAARNP